jgi:putative inorganic carbon (hco3(-)) transporter
VSELLAWPGAGRPAEERRVVARGARLAALGVLFVGALIAAAFLVARHPLPGLLAVALGAAAIVAFARPEIATFLVVALIAADTQSVLVNKYHLPTNVAAIIPILLIVPIGAHMLRREGFVMTPMTALVGAWLVILIMSGFGARDMGTVTSRLLTFTLEGLLTFLLVTNAVRSQRALRLATWALVCGIGLLGAVGLVQGITHSWYRTFFGFGYVSSDFYYGVNDQPRIQGPIGDPNYFAQVLLIAIPLGVVLAVTTRSVGARIAAAGAVACCVGSILFTYSRGAEVAFVLGFLVLVMLGRIRARYALLLAAVLAAVILIVPTYRERVASLGTVSSSASAKVGSSDTTDTSVASRATEMRAALLVWENHPILGVGPDQFPLYYQEYAAQVGGVVHKDVRYGPEKGTLETRVTHNILLGTAANLGAIGLALLLAIIAVLMTGLWRARRYATAAGRPAAAALADGYLVAFGLYLAAGMFLELAYERYFWLLLALGACAARLAGPSGDPSR